MIIPHLFTPPLVSPEFRYPEAFLNYCRQNGVYTLFPWCIFDADRDPEFWMKIVREWYPTRSLVPFARDESTSDDIACFDGADKTGNPKVHFVHCFATIGWEDRGHVEDFDAWLKIAKRESDEYWVDPPEGQWSEEIAELRQRGE
jgi:hypothetical protein